MICADAAKDAKPSTRSISAPPSPTYFHNKSKDHNKKIRLPRLRALALYSRPQQAELRKSIKQASTERYRAARGLPVFAKAKLKSGPRPIGHKAMTRQEINKRYYLKKSSKG